jgi:hypothetical protein
MAQAHPLAPTRQHRHGGTLSLALCSCSKEAVGVQILQEVKAHTKKLESCDEAVGNKSDEGFRLNHRVTSQCKKRSQIQPSKFSFFLVCC